MSKLFHLFQQLYSNTEQKLAWALSLGESNPAQYKKLLENVAQFHDSQACLALYQLGRLCLKTEPFQWYNMYYQKALAYADLAIAKDFLLGHMIKGYLCVEILEKSSWIAGNKDEKHLRQLLTTYCVPQLLLSLYILQEALSLNPHDMKKYEKVPNFKHYDHPERGPVPSINDVKEAIEDYITIYDLSAEKINSIRNDAKARMNEYNSPLSRFDIARKKIMGP
ncbi:MAG: hypothetical protein H0W64_10115 [Gammaproteobacteria bacterium]|nr:hypothetical protein [Gammaproteobacteria bacterium]